MKSSTPKAFALAAVCYFALTSLGAELDLADYRTVDKAIVSRAAKSGSAGATHAGFLGVSLAEDAKGDLAVVAVAANSPAARVGVRIGDRVRKIDGKDIRHLDAFDNALRAKAAGAQVELHLTRQDKQLDVRATLVTPSHPLQPGKQQAVLGIQVATIKAGEGVTIEQVAPGSPADRAKLKKGEVILKIDGTALGSPDNLRTLLESRKPDETVTLTLLLAEKTVEMKVTLGGDQAPTGRRAGGWDTRGSYWQKPTYRLAIICVEYPDTKHNPKISAKAWEESMFSKGSYKQNNATGQTVYGSLYDYYLEQSYGHLHVEGKAFDYVEVSKKRGDYATGNRSVLLGEALDKLLAREGKDALKDYDGMFFLYAGERYSAPRGSLYWPHRASFTHNGKRWGYFICPEGGTRMANISVFCHEFGHLLGLPDLYARPENPGMEGVGVWCAMANQVGNGKPQHFCAWSKEKLSWIKPTILDPALRQKLILAPIETSPRECLKILIRPDGSEYLLLENRNKKGFDESLPADGLLIWRVVANRPILEESHGVAGPSGPRVFLNAVPYPSPANDAFTPFTIPSSRSLLGAGAPVYITNIHRLTDGRIALQIGYEYE